MSEQRYASCQVAIARSGRLAWQATYHRDGPNFESHNDDTLWLVRSITKTLTAAALWSLVEEGHVSFHDPVVEHIPEFGRGGKAAVTLYHLLTHQAGFPHTDVSRKAWSDHEVLRRDVCDFHLEWAPGSRVHYHKYSAAWVTAAVIEAVTGMDFRDVIRSRIINPLGIGDEVYVGLPPSEHHRATYDPGDAPLGGGRFEFHNRENTTEWYQAGHPCGGAVATARGLVTFFQALAMEGTLGGLRLFSPRMVAYVTRNHTGEQRDTRPLEAGEPDEPVRMGLGVTVCDGAASRFRMGSLARPGTFGHSGGPNGFAWSDPHSGVSLVYLNSNSFIPRAWGRNRDDRISDIVHAAINTPIVTNNQRIDQ